MRNAELLAKRVQHRFAIDAEPRFDEPRRIVDAGMNDFAVARTHPGPDPAFAFEDDHLPPCTGERPRDGEADDACADDKTLNGFHSSTLSAKWSVLRGTFFALMFSRSRRVLAKRLGEEAASVALIQLNAKFDERAFWGILVIGFREVRKAAATVMSGSTVIAGDRSAPIPAELAGGRTVQPRGKPCG